VKKNLIASAGMAALLLGLAAPMASAQKVDPKLPKYQKVSGVSGNIKSEGSDTMNNLMTLWGEGFRSMYPSVQIEIQGKGSATGPPALINGTSTFCPMSRAMKDKEIDEFEKAYGYKPAELPTSIDMLAVYVHKDNPIRGLTLQQVDAIFSKTRRGGYPKDVTTWGDLGLTGEWEDKPISLYGRNSASGTYGYFKDYAIFKGDYKDSVKEQPGSSSVVQGVASDRYGIGYSGIGYKTADVIAVPLALDASNEMIAATPENAYSGDYPLSRFLYVYVNYKPGTELDPLRREFVRYVFSFEGQSDVVKDGYFPVTHQIAGKALASVGIEVARGAGAGK
jgi:phosphate transport system substrate-binding protein